MEIVRIGLDLAKNIFEVHGVDARENAVLRKTLRRDAVAQFFADLAVLSESKRVADRTTGQGSLLILGMKCALSHRNL